MFSIIVVALKFNETGRRVLEFAADLAIAHQAEVVVVHALDYRRSAEPTEAEQACRSAEIRFDAEFMPDALRRHGRYRLVCQPDEPAMAVCRTARDIRAGGIVFGCHRSGKCLSRVDYTGMTIMDKAPCPVLLVPSDDKPTDAD